MTQLYNAIWPITQLPKAIPTICRTHRIGEAKRYAAPISTLAVDMWDEATTAQWVRKITAAAGLQAEETHSSYGDLVALLTKGVPILLQLSATDGPVESALHPVPSFLVLLKSGYRKVALLRPDNTLLWVSPEALRTFLCQTLVAPHRKALAPLLDNDVISAERRPHIESVLVTEMLTGTQIHGIWLLRIPPHAPLERQFFAHQLYGSMGLLLFSFLGQLIITLLAWWMIGRAALAGHFVWGWFIGWALLLMTSLPLQFLTNYTQGQLATMVGAIFKQRLLYGALQLVPDAVRTEGAGRFLGRVMAAEAMEQLAFGGGFAALLALIQLGAAAVVLGLGAGGWLHALLLGGWAGLALLLGVYFYWKRRQWDHAHHRLTNDLVERMVGHRTRLAQENQQERHAEEDQALDAYYFHLQQADRSGATLMAVVTRGWMVVGLGWLFFVLSSRLPSPAQVAIALGGVLLARQALSTIVLGLQSVIAARLAWEEVAPLWQASTIVTETVKETGETDTDPIAPAAEIGELALPTTVQPPLMTLRNVTFRYRDNSRPVLNDCSLTIQQGDRLLLEGPSGSGKSTLAAIMAGLRVPHAGLLLQRGIPMQGWERERWRQRVVVVPQFHENHVLTGTLAFNLLMGRRWPPTANDMAEAAAICRAVGLGALLARMPAGLQQIVGESGWQLSHGERSRLYVARAILQRADLVILDESFGALDPHSLQQVLQTALTHIPTLMVIAHP